MIINATEEGEYPYLSEHFYFEKYKPQQIKVDGVADYPTSNNTIQLTPGEHKIEIIFEESTIVLLIKCLDIVRI